jgi:hypothetical protein
MQKSLILIFKIIKKKILIKFIIKFKNIILF